MGTPFAEHPLRRQVVGEMHLRRFPAIAPPAQTIQLVRLVPPGDRAAERTALATLPGVGAVEGVRHAEGLWPGSIRATWERHSEASTVTLTLTDDAALPLGWTTPAGGPAGGSTDGPARARAAEAVRWAEALPGSVIRATRVLIVADDREAEAPVGAAAFRPSHLVSCHVAGGARIWTDFRIHEDGYGRMVVAANGLPASDLARCVQRLQELGNYRNLALLGLPVVQETWPRLDAVEGALARIGQMLHVKDRRDDELLDALTSQSAQLLAAASGCDYRLSATAAYAVIVADRLAELQVVPIAGFQSLTDFIGRRFHPAVRTCAALSDRLALLNGRAAQFTALLRTRIETHIENQNARLLHSMDRSARLQLQLQHLVEGLSAVAISYYLLGLIGYPVKAWEKVHAHPSSTLILGLAAPVIVACVFLGMRRIRRRLVPHEDSHGNGGNDDGNAIAEGA